jgi:rhodanese-related sulfurtransferase
MRLTFRVQYLLFLLCLTLTQCERPKLPYAFISVDEVYAIINDSLTVSDYVVLDTRGRMDYVRGHLVSALWLPADSAESKVEMLAKEARPLVLYDDGNGKDVETVSNFLLANNIKNFLVMKGGFFAWTSNGYPAAIQLVTNTSPVLNTRWENALPNDVPTLIDRGAVLVDVRQFPVFREAHIKGATSIPYVPLNEFVVKLAEQNYPRSRVIILYGDNASGVAEKAAEVLLRNDFQHVFLLEGGFERWSSENHPIAFGP